jgi:hypothetical protein
MAEDTEGTRYALYDDTLTQFVGPVRDSKAAAEKDKPSTGRNAKHKFSVKAV